jgi:hypothetical protein
MNIYEPLIPRFAFGIAAVAMTAITIGVSVIMPAKMGPDGHEPRILAASKVTAPASTGVVADVAAVHEPGLSTAPCIAQVEPQAGEVSKTISRLHANHVCCAAAQIRAYGHSMAGRGNT